MKRLTLKRLRFPEKVYNPPVFPTGRLLFWKKKNVSLVIAAGEVLSVTSLLVTHQLSPPLRSKWPAVDVKMDETIGWYSFEMNCYLGGSLGAITVQQVFFLFLFQPKCHLGRENASTVHTDMAIEINDCQQKRKNRSFHFRFLCERLNYLADCYFSFSCHSSDFRTFSCLLVDLPVFVSVKCSSFFLLSDDRISAVCINQGRLHLWLSLFFLLPRQWRGKSIKHRLAKVINPIRR